MGFAVVVVDEKKGDQEMTHVVDNEQAMVGEDDEVNWHERSALQSVAVRRSTGNDVSGHYFHRYFLFFFSFFFLFFSVVYFSHRRTARIKKLI